MNSLEAVQALRLLIIGRTGIAAGRVWLSGERENIPKDQRVFVTLSPGEAAVTAQNTAYDWLNDREHSYTQLAMPVAVEVASRGVEAIERYPEVLAAIGSDAAKRDMESRQYSVYRSARVINLSDVAGAGVLRRYRIPVTIQFMQVATADAEVYDKFRLTTEEEG